MTETMRSLDIVVFGLSITSAWGNGHATTYRALLRALAERGHRVRFFERDMPWYAAHRDLPDPPYARTVLYSSLTELRERLGEEVRADLVMIGSYVPEAVRLAEWALPRATGLTAFYDIDTPVTVAHLERGDCEYLTAALVPRFDLYLSFAGGPILERLLVLTEVYRALHQARSRRGALDFDAAEAEFVIDDAERVRGIELRVRNDAHRLIEECMILANVAVAEELEKAHVPTLYRVHGTPEDEKLERLAATLKSLGIEARIPKTVTTRDLQAIARRVADASERAFVESLVVRAMPQAIYQPTNIGHFGLALTHYAHFTSPIRRYPDLVVHRTLKSLIGAKGGAAVRYAAGELGSLGESTSRLEKRADEADRYVSTFLKCTYLKERIGQAFRGLVTTVVDFGCFVQILDAAVDGLLHIDSLRDDTYVMEDDGHGWRGRRSGRRLRTGSHINVVVTAVNPIEGLIDLSLAEEE